MSDTIYIYIISDRYLDLPTVQTCYQISNLCRLHLGPSFLGVFASNSTKNPKATPVHRQNCAPLNPSGKQWIGKRDRRTLGHSNESGRPMESDRPIVNSKKSSKGSHETVKMGHVKTLLIYHRGFQGQTVPVISCYCAGG